MYTIPPPLFSSLNIYLFSLQHLFAILLFITSTITPDKDIFIIYKIHEIHDM